MPQLGSQVLSSPMSRLSSQVEPVVSESWSLQLRLTQVIAMWAVIGVSMFAVFLFGLYTGKKQGLEEALLEQRDQVVRFPLPPIASMPQPSAVAPVVSPSLNSQAAPSVSQFIKNETTAQDALAANRAPSAALSSSDAATSIQSGQEKAVVAKVEPTIAPVPTSAAAPVAGFAAKSAEAVLLASNQVVAQSPIIREQTSATKEIEKPNLGMNDTSKARARLDSNSLASIEAGKRTAEVAPKKIIADKIEKQKVNTTPAPAPKIMSQGWYVQVAATKSSTEAANLSRSLKGKGVNPVIQTVRVGNEDFTRVMVGPFSGKDSAASSRKKIAGLDVTKGQPFLKYIGN